MKKGVLCLLSMISLFVVSFLSINVKADTPSVYYFSDDYNVSSFIGQIINNTSLTSNDIEYYHWETDFRTEFEYYYDDFDDINDSFVIFELLNGFESYYNRNNVFFTDELEDVFETLKYNGCYIMFICATDELIYESDNDFLDYVDFHVITSSKHHMILNFFYYLENNYGNPPSSVSLIFNYQFLQNFGGYSYFKSYYLIPYINTRYYNDLSTMTQAEALTYNGVDIYRENHSLGDYTKINGLNSYPIDISVEVFNGDVNCFGATDSMYNASLSWLETMADINPSYVYYYNLHNQNFDFDYIFSPFVPVYTLTPTSSLRTDLLPMVIDFLTDTLLNCKAAYDNWYGRCDITHMMITTSGTGWIQCLYGGNGSFYNCWDRDIRQDLSLGVEDFDYDDGSLF